MLKDTCIKMTTRYVVPKNPKLSLFITDISSALWIFAKMFLGHIYRSGIDIKQVNMNLIEYPEYRNLKT